MSGTADTLENRALIQHHIGRWWGGNADVLERTLGELEAYCYLIKRGGKPAACLALQGSYVAAAKAIVQRHEVHCYLERLSPGWYTVWVYHHPHILEVIKALPQAPRSVFDHWVLGKLFGYSEESIREFIASNATSCTSCSRTSGTAGECHRDHRG